MVPAIAEAERAVLARRRGQFGAQCRIAQTLHPLRERQGGDRFVRRMLGERVHRQFEPEQNPDRAGRDLRLHRQTGGDGVFQGLEKDLVGLR